MNKPTFDKAFNRHQRQTKSNQDTQHLLNKSIRDSIPQVRIIGDNLEQSGTVLTSEEALKLANSLSLDLVLVSPKAEPPVCRVIDYKKFLFDQQKKEKEMQKKQKESSKEQKEIRFTSNIAGNDIETKKKKIVEFLKEGHRVKVVVRYEGRNIVHKERGEIILLKLAEELVEISKAESLPKLVDRSMHIVLIPNK